MREDVREYSLPYPPSVNHYWRRVGNRTLLSREGRQYRQRVCALFVTRPAPLVGRLEVTIGVFPPDRRRRDLDNVAKAILDALEHAGVYRDDSQIDRLGIRREPMVPGGKVTVRVAEKWPESVGDHESYGYGGAAWTVGGETLMPCP